MFVRFSGSVFIWFLRNIANILEIRSIGSALYICGPRYFEIKLGQRWLYDVGYIHVSCKTMYTCFEK